MLQGAGFGIVNNCAGLFYQPVSQALGVSIGAISVYSSISIASSCVVMLFAPRLLECCKARGILTLGAICTSAPMVILSFCNALWQWYVLAALQGVGLAFTMNLVAPIILNNWFHKKLGFAVGLSASSGGIIGAIMSFLLGLILQSGGWRKAYLISGMVGLILTVPVCLFVLTMHPEDKGMKPYGEGETVVERGQSVSSEPTPQDPPLNLLRDLRLWTLLPTVAIARIATGFMQHLTTYGTSVGMLASVATLLTTLFMLGNIASKLSFGALNDHWGAKRCSFLGLGIVFAALLLLWTGQYAAMLTGAFLFGTISMFSQVQVAILCRRLWDGEEYMRSMVVVSVCAQLSYSIGISGIGAAYDCLGSYRAILVALMALLLVGMYFIHRIFTGTVAKN